MLTYITHPLPLHPSPPIASTWQPHYFTLQSWKELVVGNHRADKIASQYHKHRATSTHFHAWLLLVQRRKTTLMRLECRMLKDEVDTLVAEAEAEITEARVMEQEARVARGKEGSASTIVVTDPGKAKKWMMVKFHMRKYTSVQGLMKRQDKEAGGPTMLEIQAAIAKVTQEALQFANDMVTQMDDAADEMGAPPRMNAVEELEFVRQTLHNVLRGTTSADGVSTAEIATQTKESGASSLTKLASKRNSVVGGTGLLKTKGSKKDADRPWKPSQLMTWMGGIFEKKVAADDADRAKGRTRDTLPQFVRSFFIHEYGLRKIALGKMEQFLQGIVQNAATDVMSRWFGILCGIVEPDLYKESGVDFCLAFIRRVMPVNSIKERLR